MSVSFSEAGLIARFLAPFSSSADSGVTLGPGSDCAAVRVSRGQQLVSTTDALVEGVHFDWRWFSAEQVGHKALAVNLSDLAAAGARPRWFLCALGVPLGAVAAGTEVSSRAASAGKAAAGIARGMARLANEHGCAIVGGNVSSAREWSITIAALGEAPRPRSRAGARAGDALCVAGALGAAAAGLSWLRSSAPAPLAKAAIRAACAAQRTPSPLVEAGLAARGFASAAIDVSDGLVRDLGRLCAASGVGAEVDCDALPLGPGASLEQALSGGEDYALLFSVPRRKLRAFRAAVSCAEIGRFVAAPGVQLFEQGRRRALPRSPGFDHLAAR